LKAVLISKPGSLPSPKISPVPGIASAGSFRYFSTLFCLVWRPESELMAKENSDEVFIALRKLKATHRMVFILRCVKDYSVRETADILRCSEAKVKVDYHRA